VSLDGGADEARVRLQRHGTPGQVVELAVPVAEVDAVLRVLQGVVDQARRDGVLRASPHVG
jgi:hypothetical protein